MTKVFRQSRWDRSLTAGGRWTFPQIRPFRCQRPARPLAPDPPNLWKSPTAPVGDYLNCPFTADEYRAFHARHRHRREGRRGHDFDNTKFFEGCLPIEVMAHRGVDTLRFGPMKPAGLRDPRTGRRPYAVVQLRQDNLAGDHFSLVGFQTQMKWGEQARVLRMIPGLEQRGVRALRHDPPQHLHQRADGAHRHVADARRGRISSLPGRSPASRATSSRRHPGSSPAATPRASCSAWRRSRRRGRPPSARWRITSHTPIRGTTSRRTSRSASSRRWTRRPAAESPRLLERAAPSARGDECARARGARALEDQDARVSGSGVPVQGSPFSVHEVLF